MAHPRSGVHNFGKPASDAPDIPCDADFNQADVIICQLFHYFRFDRETSRFMIIYLAGYTPANKFGTEADNTPFMAIAKCSAI